MIPMMPCHIMAQTRADTRKKFNIEGSYAGDCFLSWCCCCCALIQVQNQLYLEGCEFFWGGKEIGRELPGTMFRDKSIEIMIVFCIGIKVIFGRWTQTSA